MAGFMDPTQPMSWQAGAKLERTPSLCSVLQRRRSPFVTLRPVEVYLLDTTQAPFAVFVSTDVP